MEWLNRIAALARTPFMTDRSLMLCAVMLVAIAHSARAEDAAQACIASVAAVRARAEMMPQGDLSRRFAENDLDTALTEMAAGDVDECHELVARAIHTIRARPYQLHPGEALDGYGPGRPD